MFLQGRLRVLEPGIRAQTGLLHYLNPTT